MKRRDFIKTAGIVGAGALALSNPLFSQEVSQQLNILLFTADDLHCKSIDAFANDVKGMTPNLDTFAKEGMIFTRAHVNCAICSPSRAVLATGRYGHNSGAMGFNKVKKDVPSIVNVLRNAGYTSGILGKISHSSHNITWDYSFDKKDLGDGRDPELYYQRSKVFFDKCKTENKPFYFMVNSHDPHRPFHIAGKLKKGSKEPSKTYTAKEAVVPGFLPDIEGVREEVAIYQNSVRRLDDTFGRVMEALEESGNKKNTMVLFLSDNGIAMPFAKANTYLASTLTPLMVRWPSKVKPNSVDNKHFISAVDFFPTISEATGQKNPDKLEGKSFLPLLMGKTQTGRDKVYTQIDKLVSKGAHFPMRCVQNGEYGYIFNAWSDGETSYKNNNEGLTMKAMNAEAKNNKEIAARVDIYRHRVLEELYDLENDPNCLNNLIDKPEFKDTKEKLIADLSLWMKETNDPFLPAFENRYDEKARLAVIENIFGKGTNKKSKKKNRKKTKSKGK